MKTTVQHYQSLVLLNPFAIGCAPLAGNTTFPINCDNRTEWRCLGVIGTMKLHAGIRRAIFEGVVLQGTFTPFVTNRTVEGMIEQSKFQNTLLSFYYLFSSGFNHHIRCHIHGAGSHQFRHLLNFHQAHPAAS